MEVDDCCTTNKDGKDRASFRKRPEFSQWNANSSAEIERLFQDMRLIIIEIEIEMVAKAGTTYHRSPLIYHSTLTQNPAATTRKFPTTR